MGILSECPACRRKQSLKNKKCACGENLDKAKKSGRVEYWINYRLPGGKQRRESVGAMKGLSGNSIEDARTALSKRMVQKKEKRVLDMLPESQITFSRLADWYCELPKVKNLRSYGRVTIGINRFNKTFGETIVSDLKNEDLEAYQEARSAEGVKPATIDYELSVVQTMVEKGFVNDRIDGSALKAFKKTDRKLKRGSNARERVMSISEFIRIRKKALRHMQQIMTVAMCTGMRPGEIRGLIWDMVDIQGGFFRLPAELTKEKNAKRVPINHHIRSILKELMPKPKPSGEEDAEHDKYVFRYRGKRIATPGGLRHSFRSACNDAGVPFGQKTPGGITFKDIRRTVKTNMVAAGVNKVYRDMILGHSLKGMDIHYIKPTDADLSEAMGRYTTWLDGQIESAIVDQTVDQIRNDAGQKNVTT